MRIDEPLLRRKLYPPTSTLELALKMLLLGRMNLKDKEGICLQDEDKGQGCGGGEGY